MIIAYRTRVILVAALVVAGVLAATLALTWSAVRGVEVERLDGRLCLEARRLGSESFGNPGFRGLDVDIMDKLRVRDRSHVLLRAERNGVPVAQSAQWPRELVIDQLAWVPATERKVESAAPGLRPEPAPRPEPPPRSEPAPRPEPPPRSEPPPRPTDSPPGEPRNGPPPTPRAECTLAGFEIAGTPWRAALFTTPTGRGFVAADSASAADELIAVLKATLQHVVPIALLLVAIGAWLLSAVSTRPINRLREAMKSVSRKDMSRRLSPSGEDREFQELIGTYNTMLERLQASIEQASRFSADAAHELRTPLTILQGRLEQAIRKSEHRVIQADLTDMMDELGRLAAITRKLLLLSQADAGQIAVNRTRVDLTDLLTALVGDTRMLVDDQQVTCAIERGLVVDADELLLRQLLNNLISNAVRYCRPGGWIEIAGRRIPNAVEVKIANSSEPISDQDRARLFDRFYRLDPSRNRRTEGTGLGLSIAREIARAHGGDLSLEPLAADVVCMRLVLPAA